MMDKIVAEEDILLFIDDALNTVGAFGYGTGEREKKSEAAIDTLMEYLEASDMTEDQCYKAEPLVSEIARVGHEEGFKHGFSTALRIVIAGLNN